jgi:hypothetical protein
MTFCGGKMADGGFETVGSGSGVDIWGREFDSLFPLKDFLSDFMAGDKFNLALSRAPLSSHNASSSAVLCKQGALSSSKHRRRGFATMAQRKLQSQYIKHSFN